MGHVLDSMFITYCLNPLLRWMRFLGIEMDPSCENKRRHSCCWYRYLTFMVGPMLLFVNLSSHLLNITTKLPAHYYNSQASNSITFKGNVLIDACDSCVLTFVVHAALYAISFQPNWRILWDHLENLFGQMESKQLQEKFLKISYHAVFFLSVVLNFDTG